MKHRKFEIGIILIFLGIFTIIISVIIIGIISAVDSATSMYINTKSIAYVISKFNENKIYRYSFISIILGVIEVCIGRVLI